MLGELLNRASRLQDSLSLREKDWRAGRTRAACMLALADEHRDQAQALKNLLAQTRDQHKKIEEILNQIFAHADALKNESSQKCA